MYISTATKIVTEDTATSESPKRAVHAHVKLLVVLFQPVLNSLPKDKFLDWSKLKTFADDEINVSEKLKFVLGWVENIVGKGEHAAPAFSPLPTMFSKGSIYRIVKSRDCVIKSSCNTFTIPLIVSFYILTWNLGPYSQTIPKEVLCVFFFFLQDLVTLKCNTSDWLKRMLYPVRSCVTFKCFFKYRKNLENKIKNLFLRTVGATFD